MELTPRLREQTNVMVLGLAFMLLFSSFNTLANNMKPFLASVRKDNPDFTGDGFIAISLTYITFAVFLALSPVLMSRIKSTTAMLIGTVGYAVNAAAFYTTSASVIYLCAALNGFTGASLWAGQGRYVMLNSQPDTIMSNTSIFWVFYKCSLLFGNGFVFYMLDNESSVDKHTRTVIITVLLSMIIMAVIVLWFLKSPVYEDAVKPEEDERSMIQPLRDLAKTWVTFITPNTIILSIMFFYIGMQVAFSSGVYSAAVGFTKQLGEDSAKLVPLIGVFVGIGEIINGGILVLNGEKISQYKWGGSIVVIFGVLIQLIAYALIFLQLPDKSVFGDTYDRAYMKSNVYVVMVGALIIGAGDACFTAQVYNMLKMMFPNDSAQIISIYIFLYSSAAASGFYGSTVIGLHAQLIVLSVVGVVGAIAFTFVTYRVIEAKRTN